MVSSYFNCSLKVRILSINFYKVQCCKTPNVLVAWIIFKAHNCILARGIAVCTGDLDTCSWALLVYNAISWIYNLAYIHGHITIYVNFFTWVLLWNFNNRLQSRFFSSYYHVIYVKLTIYVYTFFWRLKIYKNV